MTTGDWNRDGIADLAIVSSGSGTLSIEIGSSSGTFTSTPDSPIAVGLGPTSIVAQDFNSDGKTDLALVDDIGGGGMVRILIGHGDGTFDAGTISPIPVGATSFSLTVADFNGEGRADLAVVNNGDNNVAILLGNGDGTFRAGMTAATGTFPTYAVAGDFDHDGVLDLAIDNSSPGSVTVLIGRGDGAFTPATGSPVTVGSEPTGMATADLNGDGNLDLAVSNQMGNTVTILLGRGNGSFAEAANSPMSVGARPFGIAAADLNGDGVPDLAVTSQSTNSVGVLLGNGDGTFTAAASSPIAAGNHPFFMVINDISRDGKADIMVTNDLGSDVTVLLNTSPYSVYLALAPAANAVAPGYANMIRVTARTTLGAIVTTYAGTVHLSTTDGRATIPGDYTFVAADQGTRSFTVTLRSLGTQSVVFTDKATGTITGSQSIIVGIPNTGPVPGRPIGTPLSTPPLPLPSPRLGGVGVDPIVPPAPMPR